MSWSVVQHSISTGSTAQLTSVRAGDLLVLGISVISPTNTVNSISDSTGDTWVHCTSALAPNNASLNEVPDWWYCNKIGGCTAGTHTLTITKGGGANSAFDFLEISGQDKSNDPYDTASTGQGSAANPSVSLTPAQSGEIILGYIVDGSAPSAAGTGFTFTTGSPFAANWNEAVEYNGAAGTGAQTVGFTVASNNYCISAVAFKASPISLLTHTSSSNTGSSTTTGAIDTTGANLIILQGNSAGSDPNTPSDSAGNSWTQGILFNATGHRISVWYCYNPTTSATHTFTTLGTAPANFVSAWSGIGTSPFDQSGSATSNNNTIQLPSTTPSVSNELIYICFADDNNIAVTGVDQGFAALDTIRSSSVEGGQNAYLIQGTAAAVSPTFTLASSSAMGGVICSFKPSGGALVVNSNFLSFM